MWPETRSEGSTLLTPLTRARLAVLHRGPRALRTPSDCPCPGGSARRLRRPRCQPFAAGSHPGAAGAVPERRGGPARRPGNAGCPEAGEICASLVQAMNKDIMAILTPAQRAQEMKRQKINAPVPEGCRRSAGRQDHDGRPEKARYTALVQAADTQTLATLTPASARAGFETAAGEPGPAAGQSGAGGGRDAPGQAAPGVPVAGAGEADPRDRPGIRRTDPGGHRGQVRAAAIEGHEDHGAARTGAGKINCTLDAVPASPVCPPPGPRPRCRHRKSVPQQRKAAHLSRMGRFFLRLVITRRLRRAAAGNPEARPPHRAGGRGTGGAARSGGGRSPGSARAAPGRGGGPIRH